MINNHNVIKAALIEGYLTDNLFNSPKYADPKKLNRYEYQVFSQNGEDGIIAEIFRRIGVTNKVFVEFGVGYGPENNTLNLLYNGWSGFWIEANRRAADNIRRLFNNFITSGRLALRHDYVYPQNVEEIFRSMEVPQKFDLLSVDIDGNDYWVWKNINNFHPRVVVIEYNALFRPPTPWVIKYSSKYSFKGDSYFGASLKSLESLGLEKGYKLVGCDFNGINAFFVRGDLVGDNFLAPFSSEAHYEPARYFLIHRRGHPRGFGEFESV
jgi:hypothetical protein